MPSSTETIFFPLRSSVSALSILSHSIPTWEKQPGFKAAYYGTLIEDPKISCLLLEWTSKDALIAWTRAYDFEEVERVRMELVDGEAGVEPFAAFTHFQHDPTPALLAPVTEFGFFSLPDASATEEVVSNTLVSDMSSHPVMTVGKALGGAAGHVFALKPEMAKDGFTTCLLGVFGYNSVQQHLDWRATPEHAEVIKGMREVNKEMGLTAVDVLGKRRAMIEGTGIVHVAFQRISDGNPQEE